MDGECPRVNGLDPLSTGEWVSGRRKKAAVGRESQVLTLMERNVVAARRTLMLLRGLTGHRKGSTIGFGRRRSFASMPSASSRSSRRATPISSGRQRSHEGLRGVLSRLTDRVSCFSSRVSTGNRTLRSLRGRVGSGSRGERRLTATSRLNSLANRRRVALVHLSRRLRTLHKRITTLRTRGDRVRRGVHDLGGRRIRGDIGSFNRGLNGGRR